VLDFQSIITVRILELDYHPNFYYVDNTGHHLQSGVSGNFFSSHKTTVYIYFIEKVVILQTFEYANIFSIKKA